MHTHLRTFAAKQLGAGIFLDERWNRVSNLKYQSRRRKSAVLTISVVVESTLELVKTTNLEFFTEILHICKNTRYKFIFIFRSLVYSSSVEYWLCNERRNLEERRRLSRVKMEQKPDCQSYLEAKKRVSAGNFRVEWKRWVEIRFTFSIDEAHSLENLQFSHAANIVSEKSAQGATWILLSFFPLKLLRTQFPRVSGFCAASVIKLQTHTDVMRILWMKHIYWCKKIFHFPSLGEQLPRKRVFAT